MRYENSSRLARLVGGVLAGVALTLGLEAIGADEPDAPSTRDAFRTVARAWFKIQAEYVTPVSDEVMQRNCIRGMLSGLDIRSHFEEPSQFRAMTENPSATGLVIKRSATQIEIVDTIPDTPAARAGVQPGTLLHSIDGKELQDLPLNDIVDMLRGPAGSVVELGLAAPGSGATSTVKLARQTIALEPVRTVSLDDGYLFARVPQFRSDSGAALSRALAAARVDGKLKGLILDLRNNGGGTLNAAIDVAALFLSKDQVIMSFPPGRNGTSGHQFNGTGPNSATGLDSPEYLPIVILVDGDTSSAAEIVASALQDNHRAILLGRRTMGNADVQTILPLANSGAMRLTTGYWLRASGASVEDVGVEPDVTLNGMDTAAETKAMKFPPSLREDTDAQAALDYLRSHPAGAGS